MSVDSTLAAAGSGTLFGDADPVNATQAALAAALHSGALQAAASYGTPGQSLLDQTQAAEGNNVSYDPTAVDADTAQLAATQQHYLSQFQGGGLAGRAAVEAQQAQRGLNAQGGFGGVRADTLASAGTQGQVANIAQGEINDAGAQVNKTDAQQAAIALQKAVFTARVSHANLIKSLAAENANFNLRNSQQNLYDQVQTATNDIGNAGVDTDQTLEELRNKQGQQVIATLLAGLGKGTSTAVSAFGSDEQVAAQTAQQKAAAASSGASKLAVPSAGMQSAAFTTAPILPNTASAWNGGH